MCIRDRLRLINPSSKVAQAKLVFNPRGGAATATFLLNDALIELERTEAFVEKEFHTETLEPGQTKTLTLQTIPEGASSYPVRVIVK